MEIILCFIVKSLYLWGDVKKRGGYLFSSLYQLAHPLLKLKLVYFVFEELNKPRQKHHNHNWQCINETQKIWFRYEMEISR